MLRQFVCVLLAASLLPAAPKLTKEQRALHAANRLTFGPTAGDLAAIRKLGVDKWIDRQLHPGKIAEDPALLERLKKYDSLNMSTAELIEKYPFRPGQAKGGAANVRLVYGELAEAKLLRAVRSNRQLDELLADFWFNHFNVFFDKGFDRVLVTSYERDAIRPYVLGNFKDLLLATAKHPAMLFYLDNWTSVSTEGLERLRRRVAAGKRATGLNENYARELLELHTMGVDNGYTQRDVTEVARCFTGWSISGIREGAKFSFNALLHDRKEKSVLGHIIPAGRGEEDALQVIDILSNHAATAKFISTKLAQRFVSDNPPPALVARMAATFTKTRGDLREVMRTMLTAPEFWSPAAYKAKMKMPFEMVASAIRATGADIENTVALNQELKTLGQPLYRKVEPTGYYPFAEEWTNSASLLGRMNFSLQLARNGVRGVRVDLDRALNGKTTPAEIAHALLLHAPAPETLKTLRSKPETSAAHLAGLVLGGPEFQRR
ncbi:MAG: DUF1800 domain-containing protein [Bryobacteraceae bacterium]